MQCLCGKKMTLLLVYLSPKPPHNGELTIWACPPEGCGRIYMEGSGLEVKGTWYTAEQNARKELF